MFPVLTLFHLFTAEGVSADFRQEGESKIADVTWITAGHARAWGCRTLVFSASVRLSLAVSGSRSHYAVMI